MYVRGIGRGSVGTALQTSAFTNMSSTYQELNFVPSYPALPYPAGFDGCLTPVSIKSKGISLLWS